MFEVKTAEVLLSYFGDLQRLRGFSLKLFGVMYCTPQAFPWSVVETENVPTRKSSRRRSAHEIMLERLCRDPYALAHATEELKSDRDIVMKAVSRHGSALRFAAELLKGDR